jgi:MurNAc alpha-1-phosphate uridylyltransferase
MKMFPVAILAGGLATRLRPITEKIPKSLILIERKPFIEYQLSYLKKQGIKKVILCVGHHGAKIKKKLGNGKKFSIEILYSFDGHKPLGTGGALVKALPLLGENFFILYGDSFVLANYKVLQSQFILKKKKALMTVFKNKNKLDRSNVFFKNKDIIYYNKFNPKPKMQFIDYGLSILSSSILKKFKKKNFDLAEVFHYISNSNNLVGMEIKKRFYEIGSHKGLKQAKKYFNKRKRLIF